MGVVVPGVDVVRVTVVRGHRRVDVAVAAGVPVAELLPELARTLRADGAACQLASVLGDPLDPALGLGPQGVIDGQLLTLLEGRDDDERRHDDLARAVAESAARDLVRWDAGHGRRAAVLVLVALGVVAALLMPGASQGVAAAVGTTYVVGTTLALVLAQVRGRTGAWTWPGVALGAWHVALVGAVVTPGGGGGSPWSSEPHAATVTGVGMATVLWGVALLVSLKRNREWCAVPLVTGTTLVGAGTGATLLGVGVGPVLWGVVTILLLLQRWAPPVLVDGFLVPDGAAAVDLQRTRLELAGVHRLLTGAAVVAVLGCVAVTPYAVASGPWGGAWVVAVCLTFLLRVRHQSLRDHVAVALAGATAVAVAGAWAGSATGAADGLLLGCVVVAAGVLLALAPPSVRISGARWGWWGDQIERVAVAALVPCWLLGVGAVPHPMGWFT